jgi:hypothetical protein
MVTVTGLAGVIIQQRWYPAIVEPPCYALHEKHFFRTLSAILSGK